MRSRSLVLAIVFVSGVLPACSGEGSGGGGEHETSFDRTPLPAVRHYPAFVEWEVPGDYWTFQHGWWNGGHGWDFRDLDGDGLRDLVELTEAAAVFGFPDRPHWLFHRNTGAGFAPAIEWPLPPGGDPEHGVNELAVSLDASAGDLWFVQDVTGDRRPDLVLTGHFEGETRSILGGAADLHWLVYRNTGVGFAAEAEAWPIPADARVNLGWVNIQDGDRIYSGDFAAGTLADLDGDGLADLVVTCDAESPVFAAPRRVPGLAEGQPHWSLLRGTGGGFETEPVRWPVPVGQGAARVGEEPGGYADIAGADRNDFGDVWVLVDLDGDARRDRSSPATSETPTTCASCSTGTTRRGSCIRTRAPGSDPRRSGRFRSSPASPGTSRRSAPRTRSSTTA